MESLLNPTLWWVFSIAMFSIAVGLWVLSQRETKNITHVIISCSDGAAVKRERLFSFNSQKSTPMDIHAIMAIFSWKYMDKTPINEWVFRTDENKIFISMSHEHFQKLMHMKKDGSFQMFFHLATQVVCGEIGITSIEMV